MTAEDFLAEIRGEFITEVLHLMDDCEAAFLHLESPDSRSENLAKIFRLVHSIKGGGASLGYEDLSQFCHAVEDFLTPIRVTPDLVNPEIISLLLSASDAIKEKVLQIQSGDEKEWDTEEIYKKLKEQSSRLDKEIAMEVEKFESNQRSEKSAVNTENGNSKPENKSKEKNKPHVDSTVRVNSSRIDVILNLVGEIVVLKSQLKHSRSHEDQKHNIRQEAVMDLLDQSLRELQDQTLSMRMTSVRPMFLKLHRIVRDLSLKLGKKVNCVLKGEDTEIDRNLISVLNDPLVHIVRNAVDHGIETPEVRKKMGKPETATVIIEASHRCGRVEIEVRDDGRGVDKKGILNKAKERGLADSSMEVESLTDSEIHNFLFTPGFSTAQNVSDVSGRGVGLDVVKSNLEESRGTTSISSETGKGTIFTLSLPLTTAITEGLIVLIQGRRYVIPLHFVKELLHQNEIEVIELKRRKEVIKVRGKIYPLLRSEQFLVMTMNESLENLGVVEVTENTNSNRIILLLEHRSQCMAICVDEVVEQSQFVIKPVSNMIELPSGISGATILGDGAVALVTDIDSLGREFENLNRGLDRKAPEAPAAA